MISLAMANYPWPIALCCCLLCLFVSSSVGSSPDPATSNEPPIMWIKQSADRTNWYHMVYQVQLYDKNERLTMEEWVDYAEQRYRLDSVKDGVRSTYLHLGKTAERLVYKPFDCEQILQFQLGDLPLADILIGHRVNYLETHTVYGLGPMWRELEFRRKQGEAKINYIADGGPDHEFPEQFERYEFDVKEENFTGLVSFYFAKGDHSFDTVDWITKNASGQKTIARAKVIHLDFEELNDKIFKVPIGYGYGGTTIDGQLQEVSLSLFDQPSPQQVLFNVIFSEPKDDLLNSWTSERYTMRVVHNSVPRLDKEDLKESYYSVLTQSRGSVDGKVKRVRQVSWAPDSAGGQAIVYKIDQSTGQCQVSHREVQDQIIVGNEESPSKHDEGHTKLTKLSLDSILSLFRDDVLYSLIDAGEMLDQGRFRNRYYEKRINNFELSTGGKLDWRGPVSIVKRVSSYSLKYVPEARNAPAEAQKIKLALFSQDQAAATIFFFSDGYKKLLYKVVIEIAANHKVSHAYAHEQMDVSTCFDDNERPSEEVSVKYPIKSTKLVKKLADKEEAIKSALSSNLFDMGESPRELNSTGVIVGYGSALSPLQISGVQVSFDTFNVHIKMTVLDVPLSHLYQMDADYKLAPGAVKHSLMEMSASTADKCADHCDFYNCPRFSFDPTTKSCQVELGGSSGIKAISSPGSQMYTYYDQSRKSLVVPESDSWTASTYAKAGQRLHMDPRSIIEFLELAIERALKAENWFLKLEINLEPNLEYLNDEKRNAERIVMLVPERISHELDSFREYVRELNEEQANKSQPGRVVRVLNGDASRIKLQYIKLLENGKFAKSSTSGRRFDGLATYDQCEQFCEINDCHTFEYCQSDESCIVGQSNADRPTGTLTRALEEASPEKGCNVYVLDNLSKFENFGIVPTPKQEPDLTYSGLDLHACANTCMDSHYSSCQGFYHCSVREKGDGKPEDVCQITATHVNSYTVEHRGQAFANLMLPAPGAVRECTFYSRSFLAQFDKYRGKSLDISDSPPSGSSMVLGSSADTEDCASKCIQQDCLAFDSCPAHDSEGGSELWLGRFKCRLLFHAIGKSQIKHSPRCTTFVLSDKSQFNKRGAKLILDSSTDPGAGHLAPDQEAAISLPDGQPSIVSDLETGDLSGPDLELLQLAADKNRRRSAAEMLHDASHWLARLFSFSLGTICGCLFVVAWNEAYARGWLDRATRGIATRANWRSF